MQSKMTFGHQKFVSNFCKFLGVAVFGFGIIGLGVSIIASSVASAANLASTGSFAALLKLDPQHSDLIDVRAVVRRRGVAVGPRGNAVRYRSRTVVRGGVVRPGYHGGGVRWARPGWYRWPAGGAIAAGAALGFVTAAGAAAWAGAAPAPGMCWYYTDSSRRQGFWDNCP
jgi:hypothetical protein